MLVKLQPGARIPQMFKGDVCEICGKQFPYIGEFEDMTEVMANIKTAGVVYLKSLREYRLIHSRKDADIISQYNAANRDMILNDTRQVQQRQNINRELFVVPIKPTDNYLKVLIKEILQEIQIDIHDIQDRFMNDNHMNNTRRLIVGDANLTYEKFVEWLNILGYGHKILIYRPDGSIMNP